MELNAEFTKRVALHAAELPWRPSPMTGVERRMLDRIGDEVARATSIVRYAPGSHFLPHTHTGGEEFIVIEGVFQDEHGDFPAGSYIRNPPTSRHRPGSAAGCTIMVKHWQFDLVNPTHIRIDMKKISGIPAADRAGVAVTPLFKDAREDVRLERWEAGAAVTLDRAGGAELFVLEDAFVEAGETFARHDWLRLPDGAPVTAETGPEGASVWVKSGHLRCAGCELTAVPP